MRTLLLWAALAASCWAFSFNLFGYQSTSDEMHLHPLSPAETDPDQARAKRQAYQVYVDGDSSVSVDKSGQVESGNWGPWNAEGQCSRTCGGGVQVEKRQCGGDCTGPSVRYTSCNSKPCEDGKDFRAEQCAAHNDDPLDGNYHKWIPYKGKNKCELLCKPEDGKFYYKWDEKVVDGTPCDSKGEEICVDGVCIPLGCDGKLGSASKVDKCGKCDGDGSTCKTIEGVFDERNLSPGYHNVIQLPVGATAIKISEARKSSNNLALKNSSDHFYLNGNGMLQGDSEVEAAGTIFDYDDDKIETITANGPLTEEITVAVLYRKGNKDSAIKYEFSIPLEDDVAYMYKVGDWSGCSVTCGKGVQTRTPFCIDTKSQSRVNDELCEENNATKPEYEKPCETVDCEAEWFTGEWEDCSQTCGNQGEQYRVVYCHEIFKNGRRITVDDENCTETRPAVRQQCNRFACPEWSFGPWSACSEKCGDAYQYRSVTCRSEKEGDEGKLLPADACNTTVDLETERACNLGPCEGLKFHTSDWKLCEKCNDTQETREVTCKDTTGRAYPLEKCLTNETNDIPDDTRSCATQQPCIYEWTASQWSKCSTECGHGHKTRRVVCAIHQLGDLEVVDESHCQGEKPEDRTNCTNEEKCTGTWYTGPWEKCSEECGGGKQSRMTVCLNYDKKPVPEWCDEAEKPAEDQDCNTDECPTCFDSEFGCCPDNSTFATGDYFQGCSNCSISEFGCCADNITDATGPNSQGCPEFEESPLNLQAESEGSGESLGDSPAGDLEECKVVNENGEVAMVNCSLAGNMTLADEGDDFGNGTDTNGTIHCSKTEYGCCPDWYTPASGKNNEGCDTFVQGACNETQYGCCPDDVTLARGANFEGCGEPTCAASLYGCCKDRKTIAFGPHYAGCERSSFPCELSSYGCCPDGETAALGKNGKGCGENCLTTKYGCCPDGVTVAKGHHNEGCGCEYAQYGCCPDGKHAAKGSGFFGCPETCAQSQFGCCPDGKTTARGALKEGCPCQYTRYGCCPDGETTALGPKMEGCDDCRYGKYGCCPDGVTKARGKNDAGCPATTTPPFIVDGTVFPFKITQCALPQDSGHVCGGGYKLMWFYDSAEGRCSQFWHGGCGGNENKYPTKEMCETICVEPPAKGRCYLPKIEGPLRCDQPQAKYYYDHTTGHCAAFWWRGCLGNANNFNTWEECSTFCKDAPAVEQPTESPPRIEDIPRPAEPEYQPVPYEPVDTSPPHYEERPQEQPQQPQQPQEQRERPPMPSLEEICRSTQDAGPCQDYSEQFYYDQYTHTCQTFTYGGCGGNLNRFRSAEECQRRCGFLNPDQRQQQRPAAHQQHPDAQQQRPEAPGAPVYIPPQQPEAPVYPPQTSAPAIIPSGKSREACHLKVDVGRCKGAFDSWYYEVATGSCVQFKYSGCGGNSNRFHSKEECEGLCASRPGASSSSQDGPAGANSVCDEAKDTGPCTDFVTKWYYNKADGTCNRFHYGGCKGTGNRFDNEQLCKAACSNHQEVCSLPKVQGPCSGKHTYYFYNSATQQCETFVYGGCLGNTNRFGTIEECQARCQRYQTPALNHREPPSLNLPVQLDQSAPSGERCFLPKEIGRCHDTITQYYYDSTAHMCLQFYYGGCEGNANRFSTLAECHLACAPHQSLRLPEYNVAADSSQQWNSILEQSNEVPMEEIQTASEEENDLNLQNIDDDEERIKVAQPRPESPLPELCLLPEERGPCFGDILRWRYSQEANGCISFMYGGCEGNANHFTSQEACERSCGAFRDTAVCTLSKAEGNCDHSVSKWFFDTKRGACHLMMWSGCGGNGNRFSSREECESLCQEENSWSTNDICTLPRSPGPCSDAVSMWYFEKDAKECKQFTYGGCRGNENRFASREDCESRCLEKSQSLVHLNQAAICNTPFQTGPCTQMTQKWFYDFATGECHLFSYGGCEGNNNRFDSRGECMSACSSVGDRVIETKKASISTGSGESQFKSGQEIILYCEADGQTPIVWYKDGRVLSFSPRVESYDSMKRIVIRGTLPSDSGAYTCAVGPNGYFSEIIHIRVNGPEMPVDSSCMDIGDEKTCSRIVNAGLCGKRRYGSHCCRSCLKNGMKV